MTGRTPPAEAQQRLDGLRRRLYRSGATEEDLRRYTAERDAQQAAEPAAPTDVLPLRRRRSVLPAAALAVLLCSGVGIALTTGRTAPPRATASPEVRSDRSQVVLDVGAGLSAGPRGRVVHEPASRTTAADGTAVLSQRFTGVGAAVVPLDLTTASFDGGRVVVTLTASRPSPVAWRAIRLRTRQDWSSYPEVVARSPAADSAGIRSSTVASYGGAPPGWIAVDADATGRWTLVVVLLSPLAHRASCTDLRSCLPG